MTSIGKEGDATTATHHSNLGGSARSIYGVQPEIIHRALKGAAGNLKASGATSRTECRVIERCSNARPADLQTDRWTHRDSER